MTNSLNQIVESCVNTLQQGNKIMIMGVGGNAANASHFAGELAGKYEEWEDPLAVLCINDNMSIVTAITNDFGWEFVFSRQIRGLGRSGDTLIAFSISGSGEYLHNALEAAKNKDMITILLNGAKDFSNRRFWDHNISLGSLDTPTVQEWQLKQIHLLSGMIKERMSNA